MSYFYIVAMVFVYCFAVIGIIAVLDKIGRACHVSLSAIWRYLCGAMISDGVEYVWRNASGWHLPWRHELLEARRDNVLITVKGCKDHHTFYLRLNADFPEVFVRLTMGEDFMLHVELNSVLYSNRTAFYCTSFCPSPTCDLYDLLVRNPVKDKSYIQTDGQAPYIGHWVGNSGHTMEKERARFLEFSRGKVYSLAVPKKNLLGNDLLIEWWSYKPVQVSDIYTIIEDVSSSGSSEEDAASDDEYSEDSVDSA